MKEDIVTRLRNEAIKETDDGICYSCGGNFQTVTHYPGCVVWTVSEAADEIERLKDEVLTLMDGMEAAWVLLANAQYWDITDKVMYPEWERCRNKWRDEDWHPALRRTRQLRHRFLDEEVRGE